SLLRFSPATKHIGWDDVLALAGKSADENDILQKEFVSLVEKAKSLYSKRKKRRALRSAAY
ncbi:MAG TPA: hypothetical protein VET23_06195, partial [Chitinophagaceae bacterium]|nr:hypothetical protein [Chitinophagaceae bacterium]